MLCPGTDRFSAAAKTRTTTTTTSNMWVRAPWMVTIGLATGCDDMFVVHWSHVPKAGGTAMARLAKRIACEKNPALRDVNPCCRNVCVSEISCFATASTCPLVQGIGRHTSSMGHLVQMPCCGTEWFDRTRTSFLRSALRAKPTPELLEQVGVVNESGTFKARRNGGRGMLSRLRSYDVWPVTDRFRFFARAGVPFEELDERAKFTKMYDNDIEPSLLKAIVGEEKNGSRSGNARKTTIRTSQCYRAVQALHPNDYFLEETKKMSREEARKKKPCCEKKRPGSMSMTVIRHPFTRAASAFFYRGHSPNSDNYNLRNTFYPPHRPPSRGHAYSFREFIDAPEYQNVLTKMFGDSSGCVSTQKCAGRASCAPLAECHAYRNASLLTEKHVDSALTAISTHHFVGLLEAYNTSVKLALSAFELFDLRDDKLFSPSRASGSLTHDCSGAVALRLDPLACRYTFSRNRLDFILYEKVHRLFCDRVQENQLFDHDPAVRTELQNAHLCGDLNFADPDAVCGRLLEAPAIRNRLAALRSKCSAAAASKMNPPPPSSGSGGGVLWDWGLPSSASIHSSSDSW